MSGDGNASHATPPRYQYEALQDPASQIRILALRPSREFSAELCGYLIIRPINGHCTRFEALSYTWGSDQSQGPLLLGSSSLPLGLNLRDGLRQLRHRYRTRYIWIDAICINQHSDAEKTAQIAVMGQIYARAWRTMIWLGNDSPIEDGRIAMAFLSRLSKKLWYRHQRSDLQHWYLSTRTSLLNFISSCFGSGRRSSMLITMMRKERNGEWRGRYKLEKNEYLAILRNLGQQDMETAILPFLQRPWFRRRWIIQEVCLARKAVILCGSHTLSWVEFERVLDSDWRNEMWQGFNLPAYKLCAAANIILESQREQMTLEDCAHELFYMLQMLDDFQCQDPRDAIAALVGMWTPLSHDKMIDYSLSVESNYILFAAQAIDRGHILPVFYAAIGRVRPSPPPPRNHAAVSSSSSSSSSLLPSWVPDWRLPCRIRLTHPKDWEPCFTPRFTLSRGPVPTLHIRALVLDIVTKVPPGDTQGSFFSTALAGYGTAVNLHGEGPDRALNASDEPDFPHLVKVGDVVCSFMVDQRFVDGLRELDDIYQGIFVLRETEDSTPMGRRCTLVSVVKRFRPGNVEVVKQAFKDDALEILEIV